MKKWLIAAAVLLAVGLVIGTVALIIADFNFANMGVKEMVTNTHTVEAAFTDIRVDVLSADITFVPSAEQAKVVCYEDSKIPCSVYVENDVLVISCQDHRKWYDRISFGWEQSTLTVCLPAGDYGALQLSCTTGDVTVPGEFTFQNAALELTTGDTSWNAGVSGAMSVKSTTGSVEMENVLCDTLYARTTTGCIRLSGVQAASSMSVQVSTGDVTLDRVDAGQIAVKATTGDVTGTILSEKVFNAQTTTGDVTVPRSTTGGTCTVTTTTGDIDLKIAE